MSDYILSILIISKNRYEYLEGCINSLRVFPANEVEIVVSDNSDHPEAFQNVLKEKFSDMPNLKYSYIAEPLSVTKHSERAVKLSTGRYCCFIGDDDSVSRGMLDVVKQLEAHNLPGCVCDVATYYWPDCVFVGNKKTPLTFIEHSPKVKMLHTGKILKNVLSYGLQDIKYLARTYHSVISREVLEKVNDKCGCYYPALSPDMGNAIGCTLSIEKYPYINQPLIISGYSFKSASGMGLRKAHTGSLKDVPWLAPDVEDKWTPEIPKIWLGYTVWAEAGVKALEACGQPDMAKKVNLSAMFAKIWLRYPDQREMVMSYQHSTGDVIKLYYECARFMTRWSKDTLRGKFQKRQRVEETISLEDAVSIVNKHVGTALPAILAKLSNAVEK